MVAQLLIDPAPIELINTSSRSSSSCVPIGEIYAAYTQGMSLEELSDEIGIPAVKIKGLLKKHFDLQTETREDKFRKGLFGPVFQATISQAAEICDVPYEQMWSWHRRNMQ